MSQPIKSQTVPRRVDGGVHVFMKRRTLVTHGSLATRTLQLEAARQGVNGLHITTIGHAAARLAGGFAAPVDNESLRDAVAAALRTTPLGDLDAIRGLPGSVSAVAGTLRKVWLAGLDLDAYAAPTPAAAERTATVGRLRTAVKAHLPPFLMTPDDLVGRALERLVHAPRVLGDVKVQGVLDVAPVWRALLARLVEHVRVEWVAAGGHVPEWLPGTAIEVITPPLQEPKATIVSAATAYDEAVEAIRWARELLASGSVKPEEIALASTAIDDYDDYLIALRDDSALPIHFPHGIPVLTTAAGQAAAALADVLANGPTQTNLRRLARRVGTDQGPFATLPEGWTQVLSTTASLDRPAAWERFFARLTSDQWPDGEDHGATLRDIVTPLQGGTANAHEVGERFLTGLARQVWRRALATGPASMIDQTLSGMRQADTQDPTTSIAWLPASQLPASPRPYVRLLGLNSGKWPRPSVEDALLPEHVVPTKLLDPLPATKLDRTTYFAILNETGRQVFLSYARHEAEGRLASPSPLLSGGAAAVHLVRHRVPSHALSESDRLLARPAEFGSTPLARSAVACWRDWSRPEVTPHDGLVRQDHPLVLKALERVQSASSLTTLLRQPLGFVWKYALRVTDPYEESESLVLDSLAFGTLLHEIVSRALDDLRVSPDLVTTSAVEGAAKAVGERWLAEEPTPPLLIWQRQLEDATQLAVQALELTRAQWPYSRLWTELQFGAADVEPGTPTEPWDRSRPVRIPRAGFTIGGRIDRLDTDDEYAKARVIDYKTGSMPSRAHELVLGGGTELQRSLYAFAVRDLLGERTEIEAALVYPRNGAVLHLTDADGVLERLTDHLIASRTAMSSGLTLPGIQTAERYEPFKLAFPAFCGGYWERKQRSVLTALGPAAQVWSER